MEIPINLNDLERTQRDILKLGLGKKEIAFRYVDIIYIKSDLEYVRWKLADKNILQRCALKHLNIQLSEKGFIRTHKSYVVNILSIDKVNQDKMSLTMINGDIIPISRRNKTETLKTIYRILNS